MRFWAYAVLCFCRFDICCFVICRFELMPFGDLPFCMYILKCKCSLDNFFSIKKVWPFKYLSLRIFNQHVCSHNEVSEGNVFFSLLNSPGKRYFLLLAMVKGEKQSINILRGLLRSPLQNYPVSTSKRKKTRINWGKVPWWKVSTAACHAYSS
jgi:hypothetical protein